MTDIVRELRPQVQALSLIAAATAISVACLVLTGRAAGTEMSLKVLTFCLLLAAVIFGWRSWLIASATIAELRQREAWQSATIDGAGEAIMVIDDQATILTFNRAAERMFGYSAGEVVGTSLERLMTDGGQRAHAAYLKQHGVTAMVEAARLRTVHKGVRKRGDVFPFELSMTEWLHGGRRVFTGVMRDVTDHERAADDLRESHARFTGLFENSAQPLFIFVLSGAGDFTLETMNEAAEAFLGVSRFAAVGRTPGELLKDDARELKRALLGCLATAAPVARTIKVPQQGTIASVQVRFGPMRNASGEIRAVLAAAVA